MSKHTATTTGYMEVVLDNRSGEWILSDGVIDHQRVMTTNNNPMMTDEQFEELLDHVRLFIKEQLTSGSEFLSAAEIAETLGMTLSDSTEWVFPQNTADTVKSLRRSAEKGHVEAQWELGHMYRCGWGVPKDPAQKAVWIRRAAESGHARAQFSIGFLYEHGEGVPQSDVEAVMWYRKSAEQGDSFGQCSLGWMYYEGRGGVSKDSTQAISLLRKSAKQGNVSGDITYRHFHRRQRALAKKRDMDNTGLSLEMVLTDC